MFIYQAKFNGNEFYIEEIIPSEHIGFSFWRKGNLTNYVDDRLFCLKKLSKSQEEKFINHIKNKEYLVKFILKQFKKQGMKNVGLQ